MRIGIIDADLMGRKQHRFPNLCCMKISGYYKYGMIIAERERERERERE